MTVREHKKVLVIDEDQALQEVVQHTLVEQDIAVECETQAQQGVNSLAGVGCDALLVELELQDTSGLDFCAWVNRNHPDVPVIVVTASTDMASPIEAIRAGAYDFLRKPIEPGTLLHAVSRALEHRELDAEVRRLRELTEQPLVLGRLVGDSAPMRQVYDLIRRVADTGVSVVVSGESGTGKELVARALHSESGRCDGPFIAVNCAAVPAQLLESELFGHVKGAFTDAKTTRKGLFEQATGGTLLLDEVAEMPQEMQSKLLRVLQERKVRPVGSNQETSFDTRIISATNKNLEQEVAEGRFREDLYYRLNVVEIQVPPLRERGNDITALAQHFLEHSSKERGRDVKGMSGEVAKCLLNYDWPGNVRQLENWIERAVTLARYDQVVVGDLPDKVREESYVNHAAVDIDSEHLLTLEQLEQRYVERVLKSVAGNKAHAARVLGLDRRTLYRKLDRWQHNIH